MGTRNLTIVKSQNKTKVAQYGQWDGYPTGQGNTIANFLKNVDLEKLRTTVDGLEVWDEKEVDKIWELAGADKETGLISCDNAKKVEDIYPELSRDTGAKILELIYNGKIKKVRLSEDFKNDTLYCEYYYTIDLDKKTVSVNGGKEYPFIEWTEDLMEQLENNEE
jgi:hypothetical protein